jgi:hypothetical protein
LRPYSLYCSPAGEQGFRLGTICLTPKNPAFGNGEAAIWPMNAPISSNIGDVCMMLKDFHRLVYKYIFITLLMDGL